jgi:hypothetical protein
MRLPQGCDSGLPVPSVYHQFAPCVGEKRAKRPPKVHIPPSDPTPFFRIVQRINRLDRHPARVAGRRMATEKKSGGYARFLPVSDRRKQSPDKRVFSGDRVDDPATESLERGSKPAARACFERGPLSPISLMIRDC